MKSKGTLHENSHLCVNNRAIRIFVFKGYDQNLTRDFSNLCSRRPKLLTLVEKHVSEHDIIIGQRIPS